MRAPRRNLMGLVYVDIPVRSSPSSRKKYVGRFLVDTGSTDTVIPASKLRRVGVKKVGSQVYELADGRRMHLDFGNAFMVFMGQSIAGRVVFGPEGVEPILGVTVLESCGCVVSPKEHKLKKLPAISMKRMLDFSRDFGYTLAA
jgi:clan AA aspartic protease